MIRILDDYDMVDQQDEQLFESQLLLVRDGLKSFTNELAGWLLDQLPQHQMEANRLLSNICSSLETAADQLDIPFLDSRGCCIYGDAGVGICADNNAARQGVAQTQVADWIVDETWDS